MMKNENLNESETSYQDKTNNTCLFRGFFFTIIGVLLIITSISQLFKPSSTLEPLSLSSIINPLSHPPLMYNKNENEAYIEYMEELNNDKYNYNSIFECKNN